MLNQGVVIWASLITLQKKMLSFFETFIFWIENYHTANFDSLKNQVDRHNSDGIKMN
jgi:hypothetical protein